MKAREFYGNFAAAYGTCWLVMLTYSVLTRSHVNTGQVGFWGFLAVGVCYALFRGRGARDVHQRIDGVVDRLARLESQQAPGPRGPAVP